MSVQIERRWFNAAEYDRMIEAGILTEDDRVELVEGEIIKMSPIGKSHAAWVDRLNAFFHRLVGQDVIVRVQSPIHLNDFSEPQPDVALLKPRADFYAQAHPTPDDVLLIAEVADTSVEYDKTVKVPLYARALIPAVWLVDLAREVVEIYERPFEGSYRELREANGSERLMLECLPNLKLNAGEILG